MLINKISSIQNSNIDVNKTIMLCYINITVQSIVQFCLLQAPQNLLKWSFEDQNFEFIDSYVANLYKKSQKFSRTKLSIMPLAFFLLKKNPNRYNVTYPIKQFLWNGEHIYGKRGKKYDPIFIYSDQIKVNIFLDCTVIAILLPRWKSNWRCEKQHILDVSYIFCGFI